MAEERKPASGARDWFPEPGTAVPDPVAAARLAMKPARPARFYMDVSVAAGEAGGFRVLLDGRPIRTPGRRAVELGSEAAARLIAAEWQAQAAEIDPATMPATRIANSAIDGVSDAMEAVRAEIVAYAGTDLVCYRAADPARLVACQEAAWNPVLDWIREAHGALFVQVQGIRHAEQSQAALDVVARLVGDVGDPVALAALNVMTTLTGSALIALAVAHGRLDAAAGWAAAHADELYQEEVWGADEEASVRRSLRERDFLAAHALWRALQPA
jgi:chaperone required for assembly of F1-ATPase